MKTVIDKNIFWQIKKMGYGQMTAFLNRVYAEAFRDGQKAAEGLGMDDVKKVIQSVKGIGEKRTEAILEAINRLLDEEQDTEWLCGECGKDLSSVKGAAFCPYCGTELNWTE